IAGGVVDVVPLRRQRHGGRASREGEHHQAARTWAVTAAPVVAVLAAEVLAQVLGPDLLGEELLTGTASVDVGGRGPQVDGAATHEGHDAGNDACHDAR